MLNLILGRLNSIKLLFQKKKSYFSFKIVIIKY